MRFGFKLEDPFVYVRLSLGIVIFLISAVLFRYISLALQLNLFERSPRIGILFLVGISLGLAILFIVLGMLIAAFTNQKDKLVRWSEATQRKINSLGILNLWLFGLVIVLYAAFELSLNALVPAQYLRYLDNKSLHYLFFLVLLLSGSTFLRGSGSVLAAMRERRWGELLAMTALGISAAYVVATFITQISAHPFSLGWSEASRYYYASLFFAEKLYGFDAPPSVLHPTRYLLQSLPFIISDTPIWLHRLWQVFLWLFTSIATAYFLQKRLRIPKSFEGWAFGLWIFLFLLLAPVYYHLQVIAILVLWGFDRRRFWKTLGIVVAASIWAGLSRINWFPMPGILAACLYLLEESRSGRPSWRYLTGPAIWAISGTALAFGTQGIYQATSGNPADQFNSSFGSDLLWYRLLPNPTYPLGVLLSSVLVCFPLVLLFIGFFRQKSETVSRVRIFCLGGILLVMYAGSLLVSVKIGGGSNLHNLDAFLLLLLVTSGYAFFDRVSQENDAQQPVFKPAGVLTLLAILMPVLFALDMNPVNPPPTMNEAREAVMTVRDAVDAVAGQGGDVLFISERQLIVFPYIQGVRLVPDYEKVFLMEMAMSNNRNYLESFYANLMDHRYALIVSEPLKAVYKGPEYSFGEENDVWVKRVVEPILCYYQPQTTLREVQTELLVPKTVGEDCQ